MVSREKGGKAMIEVIYGQVVAKANNYLAVPDTTNGGRRIIKDKKIRAYEKDFLRQCQFYKGKKIDYPFKLRIAVYFQTEKADLDNSLKTILDCLQMAEAITDDNLCYRIAAEKRIDKKNPRIEFAIEPYSKIE